MKIARILLSVFRYFLYLYFALGKTLRPKRNQKLYLDKPNELASEILIIAHVYHLEYADNLINHISNFTKKCCLPARIVITTTSDRMETIEQILVKSIPEAQIRVYENRGRDVLPFLRVLQESNLDMVRLVIKVHTKSDRNLLFGKKLDENSSSRFFDLENVSRLYAQAKTNSFVVTYNDLICGPLELGKNISLIQQLMRQLAIERYHIYPTFAAGSMFWMSGDIAKRLTSINLQDFEFGNEPLEQDGTIAHAFERVFSLITSDYSTKLKAIEKFNQTQ